MVKMQTVRVPQKLPVVLRRDEVARLIAAAPNLKSQTALSLAHATGLRVNEVASLKVTNIDSKRMTLRVEQGMRRFLLHVLPSGFYRHSAPWVGGQW